MSNKTFIVVVFILIAVAGVSMSSYLPARVDIAAKIKVSDFPMTIGQWQATDIPLSERDYQILETRNLIMRDYKNPQGDSVVLYIIYSEDNRKVSHPPEVCYMGSGASIVNKSAAQITDSIKAVKLVTETPKNAQMVVYWYKAGSLYTDQYLKQQLKVVVDRMLRKRTSGALIRISSEIKNNDQDSTLRLLKTFAGQIEPLLEKYIP